MTQSPSTPPRHLTDLLAQDVPALHTACRLDGRVALVTGAASGLGRAIALALAAEGAVVVCADLDDQGVHRTAADLVSRQPSSTPTGWPSGAVVDVRDPAAVDRLVDQVVADTGQLDVLVTAAGVIASTPLLDLDLDTVRHVLDVNFFGTLHACRAAARVMAPRGSGSIITLASAAIDQPAPTLLAYGASKAAITYLTRVAAAELGHRGIRVNAVAPGFVPTAMTARHFTGADGTIDPDRYAAAVEPMRRQSPLGRIGEPADIAWAVCYLASDASRFVTGQVLRPNGGVTMP